MNRSELDHTAAAQQAEELRAQGRADDALELLGQAILQQHDLTLLARATAWLEDTAFLSGASEARICRFAAMLTQVADSAAPELRQRVWDGCLAALHTLDDTAPRQDTTDRYTAECILLRHMGRMEDALAIAEEGIARHNTASNSTFAGLCYLDLDRWEEGEKAILRALELDPANYAPCNDLADYFFNARVFSKAMDYYALVMAHGDAQDCEWALPSFYFCRYLQEDRALDLERLALAAAAQPDNDRAAQLCDAVRRERLLPYEDYIPDSTDAVAKMIPDLMEKDIAEARVALSCQEAASAVNAVRLAMSRFGQREARLTVLVNHLPDPPLDRVLAPEGIRLWLYGEDHDAVPAIGAPTQRALDAVSVLTSRPYALTDWYAQAETLAAELDSGCIPALYACMIHPPTPPEDIRPDRWLQLVQFAAVCLLAHLKREGDVSLPLRTYAEHLPSQELVRICLGQLDWPIIPALTILAYQARTGRASVPAVSALLNAVYTRVPKGDYCFFEHALICALAQLPGQKEETRAALLERRRLLEQML